MFGRKKLKARITDLEREMAHLFEAVRYKNSQIRQAEHLLCALPDDTPGLAEWFSRNGSRIATKIPPGEWQERPTPPTQGSET